MFALSSSSDRSPRQTRHLSYIAEFSSDIRHVRGEHNVVADTLSRPEVALLEMPSLDLSAMAAEQVPPDLPSSSSPRIVRSTWQGISLLGDTSTGVFRPLVPPRFRRSVFQTLHFLSHPGARPSIKLVSARFIWPSLKKDVREWCRTCHQCQASKVSRHVRAPVSLMPPAERRFGSLHLDIVGPLPVSRDFRYLLTVVDRFTRWPEAFPLRDISARSCCEAFSHGWLARFGIPDEIITDQGAQFTGSMWRELMSTLGIHHASTTSYHPQSNGMVERMHRQKGGPQS